MPFQRGDVLLVPFPFSDLSATKVRPAVVVSSLTYHAAEPDLILAAITSQLSAATSYWRVHSERPGQNRQEAAPRTESLNVTKLIQLFYVRAIV